MIDGTDILFLLLCIVWYFGYRTKMEAIVAVRAQARLFIKMCPEAPGGLGPSTRSAILHLANLSVGTAVKVAMFFTWPFLLFSIQIDSGDEPDQLGDYHR